MAQRFALAFLTLASPALLAAFAIGTPAGEVIFAVITMAFPVALIALGVQRQGTVGPLLWPLAILLVILEVVLLAMLALRGSVLTAPWIGGLPLATAFQFYGLFLLPMFLVCLAYTWNFERNGLRPEDLDELRRRFGPEAGSDPTDRDEER